MTPENEIREKVKCMWNHLTTGDKRKISKEDIFEICSELLGEVDRLRADAKDDKEFHEKFTFQQANEYLKVREKLAVAREAIEAVLNSQALKEAPFYNYSEAIVLAKEALSKIGDVK